MLRLVVTQPQLLAGHVEAYAALVREEMGEAVSVWKQRVLLSVIALSLLAVGAMLGGVAMMLGAVITPPNNHAAWALAIVPAVPLVASLLCLLACRRETPPTIGRSHSGAPP